MGDIIRPHWSVLDEIVRNATSNLIICTPYFSSEGLSRLCDNIQNLNKFSFWTRLNPYDWVAGASDPEELLALLTLIKETVPTVNLSVSPRLHAKFYIADSSIAVAGSSNLSDGGFTNNLEILVSFRGIEVESVLRYANNQILPNLHVLAISDLQSWITLSKPSILDARQDKLDQPVILAPVQEGLDRLLGYGRIQQPNINEPDIERYNSFIDWLRHSSNLAGANKILDRHDNVDGQNLTGHCKQSFFAIYLFLKSLQPNLTKNLSNQIDYFDPTYIWNLDENLLTKWIQYFDCHATDKSAHYSFSVLRGILPTALGGTVSTGGGASSTFKRLLPLVARFLMEDVS